MSNGKNRVFIYWDTSNIYIGAQNLAAEKEKARNRVRVHFKNMLRLAHADRPVAKAVAAGSVPPELDEVWYQLRRSGVGDLRLYDRGGPGRGEQQGPDQILQSQMLRDGMDNNENPGTAALLTGDGGFHADAERLHKRGWRIEILSWGGSCNQKMRKWAEENGIFVNLDDYYKAVTFLEPLRSGQELLEPSRPAEKVDVSDRA